MAGWISMLATCGPRRAIAWPTSGVLRPGIDADAAAFQRHARGNSLFENLGGLHHGCFEMSVSTSQRDHGTMGVVFVVCRHQQRRLGRSVRCQWLYYERRYRRLVKFLLAAGRVAITRQRSGSRKCDATAALSEWMDGPQSTYWRRTVI